ncbi:uncharacterized protein LOC128554416, partial [Mercenaria mercenaria]|uniref:uncharacterized protein LOC128554416 n=1 Tax=Mercenaria mercenaria TaxID=6596 RepID=UPI00234E4FC0
MALLIFSTFVTGSGGNQPYMSRTQVTSRGKSKDQMPSSASDTSSIQHSMDVDELKEKFPSFEWQNILKALKKHLEDTDKSLQGKEESSKAVTSSQKAAGETSKAARKEQDEAKVQQKMRDTQGSVWNSYLQKLEGHLESRDTVVKQLEEELDHLAK